MKHHAWLAVFLSLLFSAGMGSLSYCLWHNLGPRSWYERRDHLWRLLASGTLPVSAGLFSLAVFGAAKTARISVHGTVLNHLLLLFQILGAVFLGLSFLLAASMFYLEKPQALVPPAFRRDSR